jgi:NADH:ubiquinone oxidoreductase subunit 5 (subunit L)/multisubunit Na+/H+ antiporter MnhA subunit
LFLNKWYFDELYQTIFVRPVHFFSRLIANFDKRMIDGFIDMLARGAKKVAHVDDLIDRYLVDGIVNLTANWTFSAGRSLRAVQTGRLRQYVMFIVVGAVALTVLIRWYAAVMPSIQPKTAEPTHAAEGRPTVAQALTRTE